MIQIIFIKIVTLHYLIQGSKFTLEPNYEILRLNFQTKRSNTKL